MIFKNKSKLEEEFVNLSLSFEYCKKGFYFANIRYGERIVSSKIVSESQIEEYSKNYQNIFEFDDTMGYFDLMCGDE